MLNSAFAYAVTTILLDQTNEFVGVYDVEEGWFTHVNPAGVRLLGYPSAQALYGDPLRSLLPQALTAAEWQQLRNQVIEAVRFEVETEIRRFVGEPFWARVEMTSFFVEGAPFFLIRLTEQNRLHRAERDLAESQRRFEAVVASATIGIVVCDRAGAIVSANQMAHQQFGYPDDALPGLQIEALVPNAAGRRHVQLRESFNAQPTVRAMSAHRGDLTGLRRDGAVFPVEVSLSYFHLDDALYTVAYILDVTDKKAAERALIAARERAERLNAELEQKVAERTHALLTTLEQLEQRKNELAQALAAEQELGELKSRFVSMASHEFRTPLTAVLTSADLIAKYPAAEQQPQRLRHLARIRQTVIQLNDILEEFLSVGRIEEGKVEARPARLDLPALLRETTADVQALRKPGQSIATAVDCPGQVWLDPSLLRKILVNLLSNALKYSGENTEVTVRVVCAAGRLTLVVQDQGMGISAEDQEHLFERFFRARSAANVAGTGLGLYIIGQYLELMGGTIDLQSELNVGTTVTITVPYDDHLVD